MNKERHLDAPGKGQFLYDYKHDTLTFKIKDRDYKMSVEFQNFALDIDSEDFVTGIRIFDASKVFGLKKLLFHSLAHGSFESSIKDNVVSVRLNFIAKLRNKLIQIFAREENFTQQVTAPISSQHQLQNSIVTVSEAIAA